MTRCPIVLHLFCTESVGGLTYENRSSVDESEADETASENQPTDLDTWAEFADEPGRKLTDFNEVRNELMKRTIEVAGEDRV